MDESQEEKGINGEYKQRGGMDEWGGRRKQRRGTDREWIEGVERREKGRV